MTWIRETEILQAVDNPHEKIEVMQTGLEMVVKVCKKQVHSGGKTVQKLNQNGYQTSIIHASRETQQKRLQLKIENEKKTKGTEPKTKNRTKQTMSGQSRKDGWNSCEGFIKLKTWLYRGLNHCCVWQVSGNEKMAWCMITKAHFGWHSERTSMSTLKWNESPERMG